MRVGTGSQPVLLGQVQPPGKKPMDAADWARGARLDDSAGPVAAARAEPADRRQPRAASRWTRPVARRSTCCGRCRERDAYANLALPALLRERGITGRDAAFATELAYGTCRTRGLLDAIIGAAAGRAPDRIDPVLLDLLRLGAYQLLRTRVDAHAAVSTTVEQAGIEFDSARAGFVNAVLRTIAARDEQAWVAELAPAGRRPTPSGTSRSCTPIRAGSPRRSRTRSGRAPANSTRCWPATTTAPRCTWRPGPA